MSIQVLLLLLISQFRTVVTFISKQLIISSTVINWRVITGKFLGWSRFFRLYSFDILITSIAVYFQIWLRNSLRNSRWANSDLLLLNQVCNRGSFNTRSRNRWLDNWSSIYRRFRLDWFLNLSLRFKLLLYRQIFLGFASNFWRLIFDDFQLRPVSFFTLDDLIS
jgi:hypothetical protein